MLTLRLYQIDTPYKSYKSAEILWHANIPVCILFKKTIHLHTKTKIKNKIIKSKYSIDKILVF